MINLNRFSASHRKSTNDTILQNISISRLCVCVCVCVGCRFTIKKNIQRHAKLTIIIKNFFLALCLEHPPPYESSWSGQWAIEST